MIRVRRFIPRYWRELLLFVVASTVYYASHYPIAASNEGVHYALIRAIGDEGRFALDTFFRYTSGADYAYREGHFYADRPPGTALINLPFYLLGKFICYAFVPALDAEKLLPHFVLCGQALFGAGVVLLFLATCRRLGVSELSAWLTALMLAFGSQVWKFSAHLFSHIELTFFVALVWYMLVCLKQQPSSRFLKRSVLFTTGILPFFGYEALVLAPFIVIGVWWISGRKSDGGPVQSIIDLSWVAAPLVLLAGYHHLVWGAPWKTFGAFQSPSYWRNSSLATTFSSTLYEGAQFVLFNLASRARDCPVGLFFIQPLLLIGLLGYPLFWRRERALAVFQLAGVAAFTLFFLKFWDHCGGSSGDPRYLLPIVPMLYLPLAFLLDFLSSAARAPVLKAVCVAACSALACWGVFACLLQLARFHGHDFDFHRDVNHYSLVSWDFLAAVFSRVFVSWRTVPYFLAGLAAVVALLPLYRCSQWIVRVLSHRKQVGAA